MPLEELPDVPVPVCPQNDNGDWCAERPTLMLGLPAAHGVSFCLLVGSGMFL